MVIVSVELAAQPASLTDSLRHAVNQPMSLTARLDTRNSFITGKSAQVRGVKVGATHENVVGYGIGFNWLAKGFKAVYHYPFEGGEFEAEGELRYYYFSPYFDYTFYRKNNWYVTIPVQVGIGWSHLKYDRVDNTSQKTATGLMITYEPAMAVEYRLFKYLGVGAGVGYRLMIVNQEATGYQFNSPVYLLKFRILFSKIYEDLLRER